MQRNVQSGSQNLDFYINKKDKRRLIKRIKEGWCSEPPGFSSSGPDFLFGTGIRGSFDRLKLL
jgi:hypothetical protein